MHRTKIIFNPKSHGGEAAKHLEQVKSLFAAAGIPHELALTDVPGDGRHAALDAVTRGFTTVVAAGGDGLAGEVAGALVGTATVFITDMNEFAAMNEIYGQYFSQNPPARSTVQVARLPRDAKVEIECIAEI